MVEAVKQECLQKKDRYYPQKLVYKPGEEAKQAWVATLQNAMEASNNEELTNILQKISQAEEIPLQWSRYNRENFSRFLKHVLVDYQDNPKTDEQLWSLMIKERPKKKRKKCKKKNGRKYVKDLAKYEKKVGKDTIKKWKMAIKNILQTNINEELKTSLKKIRSSCKVVIIKKHQAINEITFANLLKTIPGYQVNSVIDEQLRILISDELDIQDFKENDEQLLAKGLKAKSKHEVKWLSFLTNLIDRENGKLVNDAEEKIALHENILLQWKKINKIDFKRFLSNKLAYEVNSEIANDLWNCIEKVHLEEAAKQKQTKSKVANKKLPSTLRAQKQKQKQEKQTGDTDSTAKKSAVEAVEVNKVAIPKTAEKTIEKEQNRDIGNAGDIEIVQKNVDLKIREESQKKRIVKVKKVAIQKTAGKKQKRDIENAGDTEGVQKNFDLKTRKDVQKKRTVKVKKVAIQKTAEKTKEKKRKREIEPIINGNSPKKIKETVELKARENELCSSLNNIITVSQTEEPCCKVKWISIGKMLLHAADNKELPLKKFQKKIIAEYLNRMGTAVSDKSSCSETLWSKCQSKLSKNPKFQIDSKRIRLVV